MVRPQRLASLLVSLLALWPALAGAAPGVTLTWSATTGTGTTGGPSIDAVAGDVLTLDVVVAPDVAGMQQVSLSLAFDPSILTALSAVECPSPPNPALGLCYDGVTTAQPFTTGVGSSGTSNAGDFDFNFAVGSSDVALFLADFGQTVPPANPAFDLNGDFLINILDLIIAFPNEFGYPGSPGIVSGGVEIIETAAAPGSALAGSFTLAQVGIEVLGGGGTTPVQVVFRPGVDGYVDGTPALIADSNNPAGLTVVSASVTTPGPHVPAMGAVFGAFLAAALLGVARRAASRR